MELEDSLKFVLEFVVMKRHVGASVFALCSPHTLKTEPIGGCILSARARQSPAPARYIHAWSRRTQVRDGGAASALKRGNGLRFFLRRKNSIQGFFHRIFYTYITLRYVKVAKKCVTTLSQIIFKKYLQ